MVASVPRSDPQNEILIALLRNVRKGGKGITVKDLMEATGRSEAPVRRHLRNLLGRHFHPRIPWIAQDPWASPSRYHLTDKGREVARFRARRS